jgi:hypothetical protein
MTDLTPLWRLIPKFFTVDIGGRKETISADTVTAHGSLFSLTNHPTTPWPSSDGGRLSLGHAYNSLRASAWESSMATPPQERGEADLGSSTEKIRESCCITRQKAKGRENGKREA